jgi:hypothetical protein
MVTGIFAACGGLRVSPAITSCGIFRLLGAYSGWCSRMEGHLRRTGGIGTLIVVLVLGYRLYAGAIGPERLLGELLGRDAGSGGSGGTRSGPSAASGAPAPPSPSEARAMLRVIEVAPAGRMAGYSREEFPHWAANGTQFGWYEPGGHCDVRDDTLIRDGRGVEVDEKRSITAGEWLDPYTGTTLEDSEDVDIDHIVPSPTPGAPARTIETRIGGNLRQRPRRAPLGRRRREPDQRRQGSRGVATAQRELPLRVREALDLDQRPLEPHLKPSRESGTSRTVTGCKAR